MEKFSNIIVKYRWLVLALVLLMTAFFGYQLKYLQVKTSIVDSLPKNDTVVQLFKDVGKEFGGNEIGMLIIEDKNVLNPDVLKSIKLLTDTIANTKGILSVTSLTNVMNIKVEDDNFEIGNLINRNNWPKNEKEAEDLKNVIVKDSMVAGNLISKDGTASIIFFTFQNNINIDRVSKQLIEKVDKLHLQEKHYFYGSAFITQYVSEVISDDLRKLIPISFLVIALILFLSFRSVRGVVLPLLTAGLAILWGIGTFVLFGLKLSMVSNNVPIIILAVGSAYTIHVINRVSQCREKDTKKAIVKALSAIAVPVILTALTTLAGFLSFIFGAYLSMIRDFGLLAALGTFYSAFLALVFVPALLAVLPAERAKRNGKVVDNRKSLIAIYLLIPMNKFVTKHPYYVLLIWGLLFIISITGIFMIKRNVSISGYFKSNHPISQAERILQKDFGGSKPVFIVFNGNMQSPEVLKSMLAVENYMRKSPYITNTQSIADIVARLNKAMSGEKGIPDSEGKIQQLWFLLDQQQSLNQLVTDDFAHGVIIAKFVDFGSNNIIKLNKYMQDYFKAHPSNAYTVEMTGMPFVTNRMDKSLVNSQIVSLAIAIILVIALVSFMFQSFVKGLYASLPILTAIGIIYGIMGLFGIPLNIVTVLVASVAMGIGIDYAIHFISHFNHSLKRYKDIKSAIEETMLVSGKAIIINFLSVSGGFLVLTFSDLVPMVYFGILIAISMLGSSMGALTLLPAILLIENKKNEK